MAGPGDDVRAAGAGAEAQGAAARAGAAQDAAVDAAVAQPDRGRFNPTQRLLITLAAIGITLIVLRTASSVVVPILLALMITMAVSPLLHLMIRHRVPAVLAWLVVAILTTAVVVCAFVLGGIGVARLIGTLHSNSDALQAHLASAVDKLNQAGIHASGLTQSNGLFSPQRILKLALALLQTARRVLGTVALTLLLVYFMLAEATTLQLKFAQTPPNVNPTLQRLELFTRDMRAFIQSATILGLINGAAAAIVLWLLGIDFPVLWGVFAFVATFIPTLGFFIAVLPPAFLALLSSGWKDALLVLLAYLVIFAVTASLRNGRLVGGRLNLSPLVIILSIVLWGWVLGLMGGLLAVPMTLLVRRLFVEAYDESRWITDLLGRPHSISGPGPAAGAPPPG
jgi:AI-2 transport protein TqsA